ncbi:efflux RND transporter permease subunit [Desulfogranum japonicum]|uniref:efflux RND transporter permease subunit n=1 Tax=Desulfogranum japonicum TaxID=231447 RepID=UPI0004219518|nr:MMPL family transporter [Desulfogranum japonicum]
MNIHTQCEGLFRRLCESIYTNKYIALLLVLALTGGLAAQLPKLAIDTRDEVFFRDTDPALIAYNQFKQQFGQDELFIIALRPENGMDTAFFQTLYNLHHELEQTVPYLDDITSLVNGRVVWAEGDTLHVDDIFETPPQTEAEVQEIKKRIAHYPMFANYLISGDGTLASIIIKTVAYQEEASDDLLAGFAEDESFPQGDGGSPLSNAQNMEVTRAIKNVVSKYQQPGLTTYLAGSPAVVSALQIGIEKDLGMILPLSMLLIIFSLGLLYRRLSGVIYPLLIVFLSLVTTFGFMALAGFPITLVTEILPSFLLIVGVADAVHILTLFYLKYNECGEKQQAIIDAMGAAGLPVLMTSITTACGLLSFACSDVATIAQLGFVAPVGVFLAFFYTIVLLPVCIALFPIQRKTLKTGGADAHSPINAIFSWIARLTTRHAIPVALCFGLLFVGALYCALDVRFSHNISTWFPADSQIRMATDELDQVNGGSVKLEAVINTGKVNGLHDPDVQQRLDQTITDISTLEVEGIRAGKVWGLPDVLKETNRALHNDHQRAYTVPQSQQLIAQELMLFESSGSDDLEDFTDRNYQTARLSIMAPFEDSVLYLEYIDQVEQLLQERFPDADITITGKIKLFVTIVTNALTSMIESYGIALVLISILMIIMAGRIRIGLLSMVANVGPIILVMGLMGIASIPIDLSSVLVGSLVLGIVVDDTIHFLHHFQRCYQQSADVEKAVHKTMQTTGRALFITSLVLCGGFYIYMIGTLNNNVRFGMITGTAIIFALAADFFLLPALLSIVYSRHKRPMKLQINGRIS